MGKYKTDNNVVSYTFSVLRYVHDVSKGEFANVGVVLSSADTGESKAILLQDPNKVARMFPDVNTKQFCEVIRSLQDALDQLAQTVTKPYNVYEIAFAAIPQGSGSFQWSGMGCGKTDNLESAAVEIFQRYIFQKMII